MTPTPVIATEARIAAAHHVEYISDLRRLAADGGGLIGRDSHTVVTPDPFDGNAEETGQGTGIGTTFNRPLPLGVSRQEYFNRSELILDNVATRWRPELVLLSAGFDAHRADAIICSSSGFNQKPFDLSQVTKIRID